MNLFGLPYYYGHIDKNDYDKETIVKTIEDNYNIDPERNAWDNETSNMHHAYDDWENTKFKVVNFESLIPIYTKEIDNFLKTLKFKENTYKFNFHIINYTCIRNSQSMRYHDHYVADFSGVHYLKFNPSIHYSTLFHNHSDYSRYFNIINENIFSKLDTSRVENSWMCGQYEFNTIEDDVIIFPGILAHSVIPFRESDDLRMTIAFNINLE